ncbi:thioesterase family protein [Microbacterium sp. APC 3898]|uniref:Thioesterase family protein n=2 Tax=Planococcus TaxID=1372 RepID=A0ABT7ZLL9_9BACL|nr:MULTISPECIES: thioesterase family protein [Terrabacteria group]MBF6633169.1 acyl-CoA thioesterase [Planococcus sp. (in: firmicutes)]MBD8015162.1 acyl-CoA thioesterase [Planococcus wigleyi]MDN3428049.1 thioesterase family protein [Planococcus sp. APC 4016]MDN3439007.1 thioesterase family protein [Planococcus sp. APC 3900]MDN3498416.1 thioesterase family protein [Microbacterium sp. APC 3898]
MYKTILTPRVSETDGVGHINNTTLPVWFEAARNPLFDLFTPDHDFAKWKMVIVKTVLEFTGQIYFGKDVAVNVWVKKIGNSSLELYEELYQEGNLCARNTAVYVNYDLDSQKSEKIPEAIRQELAKHLWEEKDK